MGDVKVCCRCGVAKPLADYYNTKRTRSGKQVWCIPCFKGYYAEQRAARRANGLCRDHGQPVEKGTATRCTRCRTDQRDRFMESRYGITSAEYDRVLAVQGGGCAVCGQKENTHSVIRGLRRRLAVDHDHATGLVRGLLCTNCNTAIGKARDLPERLRAMAEYLVPTPEWIGAGC